MIFTTLTREAEAGAARYGLLTEAWRSIFHTTLNASDFGSVAAVGRANEEALAIASDFLADERSTVSRIVREIAIEARQTTLRQLASIDTSETTERVDEQLSAFCDYIESELIAQIHRDIALLRQTIQRVDLEVSIAATARGISARTALVEYRIGNQADLQFVFHDRHARKWASKKFIRAMWRHTLLAVYNEIVLMTLAEHGIWRAQVVHEDPNSDVNGVIVAMGSNSEFPTYSEIRADIFHPNANAVLRMEEAPLVSS